MVVRECCFFFQAEDGIRGHCVTGVQTCALPIYILVVPLPQVGGEGGDSAIIEISGKEIKMKVSHVNEN